MSRGVNKVILIGNLGRDPEMRSMPNGDAVTSIAVATSEAWKDRDSGEMQERTEWHNVVLFKRLAEVASEYLRKGSRVYIEGSLRTRKWQDRNGQDRWTTEIIASNLQLLDRAASEDQGRGSAYSQQRSAHNQQRSAHNQQRGSAPPQNQRQRNDSYNDGFDSDDIPF